MSVAEKLRDLLSIRRVKYGLILLFVLTMASIIVIAVSPYGPTETTKYSLAKPMSKGDYAIPFILGTDSLGRDLLTRLSYAFFLDVGVGIIIVTLAGIIGLSIGIVSGFVGGALDTIAMRTMDILISIPGFILAIAIAASIGSSLWNAIIAVAVVTVPIYARLARGITLSVKENLFVLAAYEAGIPHHRIMFKHILPHVLPIFITQATMELSNAILYVAGLSFIGLGAQEPTPEWGLMMSVGRKYIRDAWWYPVFPGIHMFLSILSFNLIGDGIRDYLDPKRKLRG